MIERGHNMRLRPYWWVRLLSRMACLELKIPSTAYVLAASGATAVDRAHLAKSPALMVCPMRE